MSQKYGEFALEDKDLSLSDGEKGISCFFENVGVDNGIKTQFSETNFAQIIEPNRETAIDEIIENIGGLSALFQYKTYVQGIEKVFLILCSSSYVLYYYELYKTNPEMLCFNTISLTSVPHFETFSSQNKNLLIISTKQDEMWVWDGENSPYEVLDSPIISSATIGLGRLFVSTNSKPYSVCYSEDLDPSTWGMSSGDIMEVNFADNLGKVIKVVSFDNYVFVIREKGIIKIYAKTNGELATSKILSFEGKIFAHSICVCIDKIVFCSSAGIYKFDGVNIKLVYKSFDRLLQEYDVVYALCKDNNYYLCLSKKTNADGYIFALDNVDGKIYEICKIQPCSSMFSVDIFGALYIGYIVSATASKNAKMPIFVTKTYQKTANLTQFLYKTNKLCLPVISTNVTILYADILSLTDVNVTIATERETKTFEVKGSTDIQRVMLQISGRIIQLTISGDAGADIQSFVLHYSYIGR